MKKMKCNISEIITSGMRLAVVTLVACATTVACTDVELCPEYNHPHTAKVKFVYDWDAEDTGLSRPDSMYVIANRVINYWKMVAAIYTEEDTPAEGKGRYVYNRLSLQEQPETPPTGNDGDHDGTDTGVEPENPETDTAADDAASPSTRADESENDLPSIYKYSDFDLKAGEYKFYTFTAVDNKSMKNLDKFISTDDNNMTDDGFAFEYNTYNKTSPEITDEMNRILAPLRDKGFQGWTDFNSYSSYVLPGLCPLFIDSVNITDITHGGNHTIMFRPHPATQTITINIKVRKVLADDCKFKIEGIVGDVSGIPHSINISNGFIDIAKTNKMIFPFDIIDMAEDTETNEYLRYTATINVPSIVKNSDKAAVTGPGMLQAFVYCTVYKDGKEHKRNIQGILNMHGELSKANLIEITEDGNHARRRGKKHTIDIESEIVIDGEKMLESPLVDGIKGWIYNRDHDIDIEL